MLKQSDDSEPPEILALSSLTYGQGLPVTNVELDMIERARYKRAWEASLPEVIDEESFHQRLKMMEQMELMEWKEREKEIERFDLLIQTSNSTITNLAKSY